MSSNNKLETVYEKLHHEYKNKDGSKRIKVVYPYTESKVVLLTKDPQGKSLEDFLKEQKEINSKAIQSIKIDDEEAINPEGILKLRAGSGIEIVEEDGEINISSNLKIDEIVNDDPDKYALKILNTGGGSLDIDNQYGKAINIKQTYEQPVIYIDNDTTASTFKVNKINKDGRLFELNFNPTDHNYSYGYINNDLSKYFVYENIKNRTINNIILDTTCSTITYGYYNFTAADSRFFNLYAYGHINQSLINITEYGYGADQSTIKKIVPTVSIDTSRQGGGLYITRSRQGQTDKYSYLIRGEIPNGTGLDINSLYKSGVTNQTEKIGIVIRDNNDSTVSNGYTHGMVFNGRFKKSAIAITQDADNYLLNNGYVEYKHPNPAMPVAIDIDTTLVTESYINIKAHNGTYNSAATNIMIDNSYASDSKPAIDIKNGNRFYGVYITQGIPLSNDSGNVGFFYTSRSTSEGVGGTGLMVRGNHTCGLDMTTSYNYQTYGMKFVNYNTSSSGSTGVYLEGVKTGVDINTTCDGINITHTQRPNTSPYYSIKITNGNYMASSHIGISMSQVGNGIYISHDTSQMPWNAKSIEIRSSVSGSNNLTGIYMSNGFNQGMYIDMGSNIHSDIFNITSSCSSATSRWLINAVTKTNGIRYCNYNDSNYIKGIELGYVNTGVDMYMTEYAREGINITSSFTSNSSYLYGLCLKGYMKYGLYISPTGRSYHNESETHGIWINMPSSGYFSDAITIQTTNTSENQAKGINIKGIANPISITMNTSTSSGHGNAIKMTSWNSNVTSAGIDMRGFYNPLYIEMDTSRSHGNAIKMTSWNSNVTSAGIDMRGFYNPLYIKMDTSRSHGNAIKISDLASSSGDYAIDITNRGQFIKMSDNIGSTAYSSSPGISLSSSNTSIFGMQMSVLNGLSIYSGYSGTYQDATMIRLNTDSSYHGTGIDINTNSSSMTLINLKTTKQKVPVINITGQVGGGTAFININNSGTSGYGIHLSNDGARSDASIRIDTYRQTGISIQSADATGGVNAIQINDWKSPGSAIKLTMDTSKLGEYIGYIYKGININGQNTVNAASMNEVKLIEIVNTNQSTSSTKRSYGMFIDNSNKNRGTGIYVSTSGTNTYGLYIDGGTSTPKSSQYGIYMAGRYSTGIYFTDETTDYAGIYFAPRTSGKAIDISFLINENTKGLNIENVGYKSSGININTITSNGLGLNIGSISNNGRGLNIHNTCGNAIYIDSDSTASTSVIINDNSTLGPGIQLNLAKDIDGHSGLVINNVYHTNQSRKSITATGYSYLQKLITDGIYFGSGSEANNINHYTEAQSSSFAKPDETDFVINAHMFKFDLAKEVTITGTISSLNYTTPNTNLIVGAITTDTYKPLYDVNGICKGITSGGGVELIPYTLNTDGELLIMKLSDDSSTLDSIDFTIKYRGL